jgi:MFS family permease
LAQAAGTPVFWLLWAAFSATWIPVFIPLVHLVRFSRDLGFSALVGASVVSALGVGAVVGRFVMGAVSDRIGRRATVAIGMGLQALAFTGFLAVINLVMLYAAALVFGYSYGAVSTLFTAIVGDFFGHERAGALVGVLFALAGSMAGVGPIIAGAIYDAWCSYAPAFTLAAGLNVLGLGLLVLCRPPGAAPGAALLRSTPDDARLPA